MKIRFTKITLFLLLSLPILGYTQSINISQETALAFKIDMEHLKSKYPSWDEKIQQLLTFTNNEEENFSAKYAEMASKLASSGISMKTFYFLGINNSVNKRLFALAFFLDKKSKFDEFIKENVPKATIQEDKKMTLAFDEDNVCVWNDKVGFFVSADSLTDANALKESAQKLLNYQKKPVKHAPQKSFEAFIEKTSDISIWFNTKKLSPISTPSKSPVPFNIDGRFMYTFLDLGKGQTSLKYQYFLDSELPSSFQNLFKRDGGSNILSQGIVDNPFMVFRGGISLASFLEIMDAQNPDAVQGMQRKFEEGGFALEDFIKIFDGDFVFWVKDMRKEPTQVEVYDPEKDEYVYEDSEKSVPNYVLGLGIQDQEKWQELKENLILQGALIDKKDYFSFNYKAYILERGKTLYVTNQAKLRDSLISSPQQASAQETQNLLSSTNNHLFIFHMQMAAIPKPPSPIPLDFLESIQFALNKMDEQMMEGEVVAHFTDKEQSLLDLIYEGVQKQQMKKKFEQSIASWLDSLAEEDTKESISNSSPEAVQILWNEVEDMEDGVKKYRLIVSPPKEIPNSKYTTFKYSIYMQEDKFLYYDYDFE